MNSRTLVGFDWAARKNLRDKAHFDILEGFLIALLKQEIKIITLYYFKNADIKENFKARNIQLLQEKLALWKMPDAERRAYERFMMNKASERGMIEAAKMEGREEGFKRGIARVRMARAMLAAGEPLKKIRRFTRLSEQEILIL